MKPEVALELLEAAAEQLKVRVSYEPLQSTVIHGGLCRVKGEYRIIVDKRASAEERVVMVATALARRSKAMTAEGAVIELSVKVQNLLRMHEPAAPRAASIAPSVRGAATIGGVGRTAA
jgi:hypothetical protein